MMKNIYKYYPCKPAETPEQIKELIQHNELFLIKLRSIPTFVVIVEFERAQVSRNEQGDYIEQEG